MNPRRFAVCLGIGLIVSLASIALYVLATKRQRRKKDEDSRNGSETQDFPFLKDFHCIEFIKNSKVMFIMRGLPGSGKSAVAHQMKQVYGDLAVICSADEFRYSHQGEYVWKAEEYETTHMMCEEKAKQACQDGIPVVVIDNTSIKKRLLYRYVAIARSNVYYVVLVEPKTSWRYSICELALKNHHNVTEEILMEQLSEFEQIIAVYYGWFLSEDNARTLKERMFKVLTDCFDKIPSFRDDLAKESQQDEHGSLSPVENSSDTILSSLSCLENPHGNLHVTTFFNKRGQPQRAYNYASSSVVQDALGSVATLMVIACTVTPRTLTARVKLNSQQLALWGNFNSLDFEEGRDNFNTTLLTESSSCTSQRSDSPIIPVSYRDLAIKPTIGNGDSAHVTLSCRSDVTPVQGRYDLCDLIRLELNNHSYEEHKVTEGVARNYGNCLWAVYFNEPIYVNALFTGFYG